MSKRVVEHFFIQAVLVAVVLFWTSTVTADVVWMKGTDSTRPRYGRIVKVSSESIQFRAVDGFKDGKLGYGKAETIQKSALAAWHQNVDEKKLKSLVPGNPQGYRDYAESLAAQKRDPVARMLARRLYVNAYKHGDERMREACLGGLIGLALSQEERSRLQRLRTPGKKGTQKPVKRMSKEQRVLLLKLVQAIRRSESQSAGSLLKAWKSSGADVLAMDWLSGLVTQDRLSDFDLGRLLDLEIRLRTGRSVSVGPAGSGFWAEMAVEVGVEDEVQGVEEITGVVEG